MQSREETKVIRVPLSLVDRVETMIKKERQILKHSNALEKERLNQDLKGYTIPLVLLSKLSAIYQIDEDGVQLSLYNRVRLYQHEVNVVVYCNNRKFPAIQGYKCNDVVYINKDVAKSMESQQ